MTEAPRSLYWTASDGLQLHALDWSGANGKVPIVGLPGLNRTARDFAPLARWLESQRRVIGVDLRGRGGSAVDPDPQHYTMSTYLKDLDRLLDAINEPQVVLVGGSNGGVLAALYAAKHPERVAGLLFNDVAHRFDADAFARVRDQIRSEPRWADWSAASAAMAEHYGDAHPGYGTTQWAAFARRVLRQEADGSVVPDVDPHILVPLEQADDRGDFDLLPVFRASANIPSLLLHGALSRFLSDGTATELVAELPLLERVEVAGVGHLPDLAEPESVSAIERLLDRVDRRRSVAT